MHLGPATHLGMVSGVSIVGVEETLEVAISVPQLNTLARANTVEVQLGGIQFALRENQVAALKRLIWESGVE